ESAPEARVYAAVIRRWQQPSGASSSVDYDNHIAPLTDATPFRTGGGGRHQFIQRGVDWINTTAGNSSVLLLNDLAPPFPVHHEATAKLAPRWVGANTAQLGQEAIVKGDALDCITEIARPNVRQYASRLDSNVLPDKDQSLTQTTRLIFSNEKLSDERADQI